MGAFQLTNRCLTANLNVSLFPRLWRAETFLISEESDSSSSTALEQQNLLCEGSANDGDASPLKTHRHTHRWISLAEQSHTWSWSIRWQVCTTERWAALSLANIKKRHKHLLLFSLSQSQTSFQYKQSPSTNISYLGFSSFKQRGAEIVISFGCHYSVQRSLTVCYGLVTKSSVLLMIHGLFISVIRRNILWGSLLLELHFWAIRSHIHKLSISNP